MKLKNSMTSSARATTEGGIVKPKVFAATGERIAHKQIRAAYRTARPFFFHQLAN
jgi:hypothetical protein